MTSLLLIAAKVLLAGSVGASEPHIDVWYQRHQVFGRTGVPQRWVNVLGNASDPDGVATLTYSLNGGPHNPLAIGPDQRRLLDHGDFNVEIDVADLRSGSNELVVAATDKLGHRALERITVELVERETPPSYSIDWSAVNELQDVCQIVDGQWTVDSSGLRIHPEHVGYDRMVAIGDLAWSDYEVLVPITIHALDKTAYHSPHGAAPGIGVLLRWQGHTDSPVAGIRPHAGWLPGCGSNWYKWNEAGGGSLNLFAGPTRRPAPIGDHTESLQLEPGGKYWFRARVETTPIGSLYSLRSWPDGDTEPTAWQLQRLTTEAHLARGSVIFNAHYVDATFGNVTIAPIERSRWDLFTEVSGFLGQSPLILIGLIGLLCGLIARRQSPRAARWVLVAATLMLIAYGGKALTSQYLPDLLEGPDGWSARQVTIAAVTTEFVLSGLIALAWGLVLYAALFAREDPPNQSQQ